LGQLAQFSRQKKLGARMPKKYQHLYLLLLYFVLPQFSLPSSTALATGNFEGWYAGIGPNIGAAASSKGSGDGSTAFLEYRLLNHSRQTHSANGRRHAC
jgi:hypothetical protein